MKRLGEVMDEVGRASLLKWMRADAMEKAAELRDAGWEEGAGGLWSLGQHTGLHLLDAREVATQQEP